MLPWPNERYSHDTACDINNDIELIVQPPSVAITLT
jgi:hypothetical protein